MQPVLLKLSNRPEGESQELIDLKAKKAARHFFMFFWHLFAAVGGWLIIRDEYWLPRYLGGSGELSMTWINMPFSPMNVEAYYFGLVLLGHPL